MNRKQPGIRLAFADSDDYLSIAKMHTFEGWDSGIYDLEAITRTDPESVIVMKIDDRNVGSVCAIRYGDNYGFVSSLILNPMFRGRGVGRKIWEAAMNRMENRTVELDTSYDWVPEYEKLGFRISCGVSRFQLKTGFAARSDAEIVLFDEKTLHAVGEFDKKYFQTDRTDLLAAILGMPLSIGIACVKDGAVRGYGIVRPSSHGWRVGPLVAETEGVVGRILSGIQGTLPSGSVIFMDVPTSNANAIRLMEKLNLHSDLKYARMCNHSAGVGATSLGQTYGVCNFSCGYDRYCPVCGKYSSSFNAFGIVERPDAACPHCGSLERHRAFWLYLERNPSLFFNHLPKKMLHVAPEPIFIGRFRDLLGANYITADICKELADVQMDICNIHMPDNTYDFILCSHVLEHVANDRKAISEFHRVLAPDGIAFLMVPIFADKTFEDPSITSPEERTRVFGQKDHVRNYGPDFIDRLREGGFKVKQVDPENFLSRSEIVKTRVASKSSQTIYLCRK